MTDATPGTDVDSGIVSEPANAIRVPDTGRARHLVFVGMMGAGKTTVGRRCAACLARPFVDTDELIEATAALTVRDIFAAEGEAGFRARERRAVADVLASPSPLVVALGGGAVLDPDTRRDLNEGSMVVWLDAPPDELARRVGPDPTRPLLGVPKAGSIRADGRADPTDRRSSPADRLARVARERAAGYDASSHVRFDTMGRGVDEIAGEVARVFLARADLARITVAVDPPYDVVVGPAARAVLGPLLASRRQVAIVSQASVARVGTELRAMLDAWGVTSQACVIGDGEKAKSLATVEELCRYFARGGLLRADAVVALGGGVVGDTAGFAAAVYHRGIDVVQVPTTLLAQVDAAVGGKTAVNLAEGKNLLGAFHQPVAVVADIDLLASLPAREYRSGLGEVVKYAFLDGPDATAVAGILVRESDAVTARDPAVLTRLVRHCVAIKAAVVAEDPYERSGRRAVLNLGHTLGHALESAGGYGLTHGEAVSVGLVFAAALAEACERVPAGETRRWSDAIDALGLPTAVPADGRPPSRTDLVALMQRDKKAAGGLTFVLPGPHGVERVDDPPEAALVRAFGAVGVEG